MSALVVITCTAILSLGLVAPGPTLDRSVRTDAVAFPECPGEGNCCENDTDSGGCSDATCCEEVCGFDSWCCTNVWDDTCVTLALARCSPDACVEGCAGEGNCFAPNGTPSCENNDCCSLVCADDPYCCDMEWDCQCSDAATIACGNDVCPAKGACGTEHGTPGCIDELCCNTVCAQDPDCCNSGPTGEGWDLGCVEKAAALCGTQGEGNCMMANGTGGCDDPECAELVCATQPWCCATEWDAACAEAARLLCAHASCPASQGDCSDDHRGPGCTDELCCNIVCLQDSQCCDSPPFGGWDSTCVNEAADLCDLCPGSGACDLPNGTAGCENRTCCNNVCAQLPHCCEMVWDAACVQAVDELCGASACPGEFGCFISPHAVGCDDPDCCNTVCLHDSFCCANVWDSGCADHALLLCGIRNDGPGEAIPLAAGDELIGSTTRATPASEALLCGISETAPGVWYRMTGTGEEVTVSTCGESSNYDTRLSVFGGECPRSLTCIADNDDACGRQASVTWPTIPGERYLILVHGAGMESGSFNLSVAEAPPCAGDFDGDDDVDLKDVAAFQRCSAPGPLSTTCQCGDLDGGGDVGLLDWRAFVKVLDGP